VGSEGPATRALATLQWTPAARREHAHLSTVELDGVGCLALNSAGADSGSPTLLCPGTTGGTASRDLVDG